MKSPLESDRIRKEVARIDEYFAKVRVASEAQDEDRRYVYADTKTWTFLELLERAKLRQDDIFCDIGCGSGRPPLLASLFCAQAVGIELHPERYGLAEEARRFFGYPNVTMLHEDAASADLSSVSLFFVYWTTWPGELRAAVTEAVVKAARAGQSDDVRIISGMRPMVHAEIELLEEFDQPWSLASDVGGSTEQRAYIQRVKP